jgi:hypothetical protein
MHNETNLEVSTQNSLSPDGDAGTETHSKDKVVPLPMHHVMKADGGMEVKLCVF